MFKDIFELQECAIKPGQKVVIVDDLIATGGKLEIKNIWFYILFNKVKKFKRILYGCNWAN